MEEIDLKSLFDYIISKLIYIMIATVLGILIGFTYSKFFQEPLYKSNTTILLTKESENVSITSTDLTLNQDLVDTYREIIKSRKVIGQVIKNLNLDYSISQLNNNVTVSSVNSTEIIDISVVDSDPKRAMNIANEIASVFNSEIVKLYNIQNIGIVDTAEISTTPYNINFSKQIIISGLLGFILSCSVIFVLFYFDNTIKTAEDIERKIGLPVLGSIPNSYLNVKTKHSKHGTKVGDKNE